MAMRVRQAEIVQYEKNPETGEDFGFGESNILSAVDHKTIKQYAYIRHDADPYTEHDFSEYVERTGNEPSWHVGDRKAVHWHCVIKCSPALDIETIARWFGVPVQQVNIKFNGRGAFLDHVQYLTHERSEQQDLGKALYPDERVHANFDFRKALTERIARMAKAGGHELDTRDYYRYMVLYKGMTIRQVIEENDLDYQQDFATLDKLRMKYITTTADMPALRMNFYITGGGGDGKGLMSRALARSFFPGAEDDDIFFEVGSGKSLFEGYDGQPVIIWNDRRAEDLLAELGSRSNVFNVFDSHPTRARQNVKYSSTNLINSVNIVNSVQPYAEFLNGLAGDEDKKQSYRRFPMIIPLHETDFDILVNSGFMTDDGAFDQYIAYARVAGSMRHIAEVCSSDSDMRKTMELITVKPVTDKAIEIRDRETKKLIDQNEIEKMKRTYGKIIKTETAEKNVCDGQISADDFGWNCDDEKK